MIAKCFYSVVHFTTNQPPGKAISCCLRRHRSLFAISKPNGVNAISEQMTREPYGR
jgi:hypothetical protein